MSNTRDKGDRTKQLDVLKLLREQVSNDLVRSFTKVENQIEDSYTRWKMKLQCEKQRLIMALRLNDINERHLDVRQLTPEKIQSDIENLKKVWSKVQHNVTANTEFSRILQYDGDMMHCDDLSESEDDVIQINRSSDKKPDVAIGTDLINTNIGLDTETNSDSSSISYDDDGDDDNSNPSNRCEDEIREDLQSNIDEPSTGEKNHRSVYISSDEVSGSIGPIPQFGSVQQSGNIAPLMLQNKDKITTNTPRRVNFPVVKQASSNDSEAKGNVIRQLANFPPHSRKTNTGSSSRKQGSFQHLKGRYLTVSKLLSGHNPEKASWYCYKRMAK